MEAMRRFFAIVLADARQRWRSPRLGMSLVALAAAAWFCVPAEDAGYRVLGIGAARADYSSAWVGMVVAMLMSLLSLVGFFIVRGTLARDIESRCWQLLVATPLSRTGYLLAKWASHLLVLIAMALCMLATAAVALWVRTRNPDIDIAQLALPLLVLGVPALGMCALWAVVFDLVPALRRTLGNALYVLLWVGTLASASLVARDAQQAVRIGEVHGISVFKRDVMAAAVAQRVDADAQRMCLLCGSAASADTPLTWTRWTPAPADLAGRLLWLLLPLPVLALCARGLDRAAASVVTRTARRGTVRRLRWLGRMLQPLTHLRDGALVSLELQHVLRERTLPAWLALLVAWGVQLFATPSLAGLAVIGAYAVFLPAFSHAALRERESATAPVVFSSVSALSRLLKVRAFGLLLIGVACTAPSLLRFAASAPVIALALLVLAASLAVWALALGALTGSARPFELLFVAGGLLALNGVGALDVSVAPALTLQAHAALLPVALFLLLFAWPRAGRAACTA